VAEYLRHGALPKLGPEIPQYTSVFDDAKRFKRKVKPGRDFGVAGARKSRAEMFLKRANNLGGADCCNHCIFVHGDATKDSGGRGDSGAFQ
jgi:hypothetical protein